MKVLEKQLALFLYPLKALKESRWEISPKPLETLEKTLGFSLLPIESVENSRW